MDIVHRKWNDYRKHSKINHRILTNHIAMIKRLTTHQVDKTRGTDKVFQGGFGCVCLPWFYVVRVSARQDRNFRNLRNLRNNDQSSDKKRDSSISEEISLLLLKPIYFYIKLFNILNFQNILKLMHVTFSNMNKIVLAL